MVDLVATYRVQFRDGMTFDEAVAIVPYLKRLGVSHLYASPIYTATGGSTHGYDVIDHNEIDPAIGGAAGFDRLHDALKREGMGLILDIVPNHMAASLENPWWRSVVEYGAESPFAKHFDIDWSERLTLPLLGRSYEEVLADGELKLEVDARNGCLALAYFDNVIPLHPATYRLIAERLLEEDVAALADLADNAVPTDDSLHDALRTILGGEGGVHLAARLHELRQDLTFIDRLHAAQPWRLMFWKEARRHLSYRRFFEVTGLAGVRVEDDAVFDDVHRLTLDLVKSGKVDGLRIDHVDGLAFPAAYLKRLRREVGPGCPIFVEKILGEREQVAPEWPVSGTTGYEFISALADLLVDRAGAGRIEQAYARFTGRGASVEEDLRDAKLLILRRNFEGELATLLSLAEELARSAGRTDLDRNAIEAALVETIVAFPIYRTYGEAGALPDADREVVSKVAHAAVSTAESETTAIEFVAGLLSGETPAERTGFAELALCFRTKFQQLTGPVMAKAVEDTLFYRRNPLIALNEVGSVPGIEIGSVDRFHTAMRQAAARSPGLLATATHDTKRGEDARARLYALAERPEAWSEAVSRWAGMNANRRCSIAGSAAPEPAVEWLLYQALAGIWPLHFDVADKSALDALKQRFLPYVEKALREAKLRTDWLAADEDYESAVKDYAAWLLSPANAGFLRDFSNTLEPFQQAGAINGLSQTLAKLTAPGVPDIYQGSEGWDFSLVDPDNRRAIDRHGLALMLGGGLDPADQQALLDDSLKLKVIARCLACRRQLPGLFATAAYLPLTVSGPLAKHFVVYLREADGAAALVLLQRLPLQAQLAAGSDPETFVDLPSSCRGASFRSILADASFTARERMAVRDLLHGLPVGLAIMTPTD